VLLDSLEKIVTSVIRIRSHQMDLGLGSVPTKVQQLTHSLNSPNPKSLVLSQQAVANPLFQPLLTLTETVSLLIVLAESILLNVLLIVVVLVNVSSKMEHVILLDDLELIQLHAVLLQQQQLATTLRGLPLLYLFKPPEHQTLLPHHLPHTHLYLFKPLEHQTLLLLLPLFTHRYPFKPLEHQTLLRLLPRLPLFIHHCLVKQPEPLPQQLLQVPQIRLSLQTLEPFPLPTLLI
jgi:hypothetical protein